MNEIAPTDMTREEAVHALAQLRGTEERQKQILLEFHDRKGYKALAYSSWEEFAERELGVTVRHYNNLLNAARVERNLGNIFPISNQTSTNLPVTHALELAKLPTPELQARAYEEAIGAAAHTTYRGKESRHNGRVSLSLIQKIVARMLAQISPKPEPPADKPAAVLVSAPPVQTPPPQKASPIKTFSPPPDPEPEESRLPAVTLNFEEAREALSTALTWVENEAIVGKLSDRKWVMATLCEVTAWIEGNL